MRVLETQPINGIDHNQLCRVQLHLLPGPPIHGMASGYGGLEGGGDPREFLRESQPFLG